MSIFNIKTAQQNAIKRVIVKKVQEPIFDRYVRTTLEKIEQSISDANGRYTEGKSYAQAKPSQNWKVVKTAADGDVLKEEVAVWLKIGVKKQGLFLDDNGKEVFETKIPSSALLDTLNEFKTSVEFVRDNRDSEVAKEFWDEAIIAAKPKSAPKAEGKNDWVYDSNSDTYISV